MALLCTVYRKHPLQTQDRRLAQNRGQMVDAKSFGNNNSTLSGAGIIEECLYVTAICQAVKDSIIIVYLDS